MNLFVLVLCFGYSLAAVGRGITVSGVSSGAGIALQMEVAYSSLISGAAIVAGVPYYCARDGILDATDCLLFPDLIPVQTLEQDMQEFALNGQIDSLSNLKSHALYLFSGELILL